MSITTRSDRFFDFACSDTPSHVGPGSYDLPGSIIRKKETPYPFNSTSARDKTETNDNPGPSDYYPQIPKLNIATASGMKSSSPRSAFPISDTPAPTEYAKIEQWKNSKYPSKRQSMSARGVRNSFTGDQQYTTSPADRDIRLPFNKGAKISNSGRYSPAKDNNPGPGSYNISSGIFNPNSGPKSARHKSAAFLSSSERDVFRTPDWISGDCGLGPSSWKLPGKSSAPFGSNSKKRNFWAANNRNPGPGSYTVDDSPYSYSLSSPNPRHKRGKKSNAAFGSGAERNIFGTPNDVPGPGAYKVDKKKKVKQNRKRSVPPSNANDRFPNPKREYEAEPASYSVDFGDNLRRQAKQAKQSASFMCSIDRNPYKVTSDSPGVGSYSPERYNSDRHKLKVCIVGSDRGNDGRIFGQPVQDTPGPASYEVREPKGSSRGVSIRRGKRQGLGGATDTPAPGYYNTETSMVKASFNVTYSIAKL